MTMSAKPRIATAWLDGCSGCHMSFLDLDEKLVDLAGMVDVVCSPTVDVKEFPENVDVALVEGAVSSEEDLHKIKLIRSRTKVLVALGDCAVTGNVPAMRNFFTIESLFQRAYQENAAIPLRGEPASAGGSPSIRTTTNRHGGILGGISSGMPIVLRCAVKPTSSLSQPQHTVTRAGEATTIATKGRHDPCLLPRFVPMGEAMVALVLADHMLRQAATR